KMHQMYPDWFRMDENGERKPDYNMCASNPDALDYVADRSEILARLMKTNSHRYAYWIDDVKGYKCNCSACRALSAADQALRIMNAMLRGIKRADPEAMLPYLAYHDTIIVPEKTQPLQGIYLEYAPINRDIHMAINDETSDKNRAESAYIRELIAFFGKKNSRVLEYWVDNSLFSNWTRPPKKMYFDSETMKKDVDFYHEVGFSQMTSFACFLGEDYIDLYGEPDMDAYGRILLGE
ncbi:MAG: DUF4838 domain-containing protein, partial [Clostridia bacterium]|nr:DUF4838 domain-containing protein [Clostridia bacterium]